MLGYRYPLEPDRHFCCLLAGGVALGNMFAQVTTLLGSSVYCSAGAWVAGDTDGKTVNLMVVAMLLEGLPVPGVLQI